MCGINGLYFVDSHKEINRPLFEYALQTIHHRGPDYTGKHYGNGIALGHNRLSILDTSSAANQPFISEDNRYAIVFNGEIFNYKLLKEELIAKGIRLTTNSDTEVLLHLLIREGEKALEKLNGFFAFAFYDFQKHEILLARDRFGEKPLFYAYDESEQRLIFSSELKALQPFLPKPQLNYYAIEFLIRLTYIPSPHTIADGVLKLRPGNYLKLNANGLKLESWYKLNSHPETNMDDEKTILKTVKDKIEVALERRMIADVPLAGFLSGGIDSSIVCGLAKQRNNSFETFSLGFSENKFIDETSDAEFAAKQFGIKHHSIKIMEDELLENVSEILNKADEPFGDSSMIALYSLCKKVSGKYKVILSGDGADELFGGYHKHLALQMASEKSLTNFAVKNFGGVSSLFNQSRDGRFANRMRQLKKMNAALRKDWFERYWYLATFNHDFHNLLIADCAEDVAAYKKELFGSSINEEMNSYLRFDFNLVLANDMLVKVDTASMYNGVEMRSPFLDHELIEYVFGIKSSLKLKDNSKKYLLKKAYSDLLPDQLINKPKHGFEVPLQQWLTGPLSSKVNDLLNDDFIRSQKIFNPKRIAELKLKLNSSNPGETAAGVWSLLNFQTSYKKYFNA